MVVSSNSGLAGLLRRTKRSAGNCTLSSTHRGDIFPEYANREIVCKTRCHNVTTKVKYAVIIEEDVVVGCADAKLVTRFDPITGTLSYACQPGYVKKREKVPVAVESNNRDQLYKGEKEVVFCVKQ